MRALTGYDRVTLRLRRSSAPSSSRGAFAGASATLSGDLPAIIADTRGQPPSRSSRGDEDASIADALDALADAEQLHAASRTRAFASTHARAVHVDGNASASSAATVARRAQPSFELHAAAELFAQLFAMRLEIDRLKNG